MKRLTNLSADSQSEHNDAANRVHDTVRLWIETAVIGLNLCPFARPVHEQGRLAMRITWVRDELALLVVLEQELQALVATDSKQLESSLLVHPEVLTVFDDYNQFQDRVDETLQVMGLEGVVQVASFHPDYRFADVPADDVSNCTNRAPYPMLHLLRENSVSRVLDEMPDPGQIPARNQRVLRRMGRAGWNQLRQSWEPAADNPDPDGADHVA